jgi:hypothetical protein
VSQCQQLKLAGQIGGEGLCSALPFMGVRGGKGARRGLCIGFTDWYAARCQLSLYFIIDPPL